VETGIVATDGTVHVENGQMQPRTTIQLQYYGRSASGGACSQSVVAWKEVQLPHYGPGSWGYVFYDMATTGLFEALGSVGIAAQMGPGTVCKPTGVVGMRTGYNGERIELLCKVEGGTSGPNTYAWLRETWPKQDGSAWTTSEWFRSVGKVPSTSPAYCAENPQPSVIAACTRNA